MPQVDVRNLAGEVVGQIELDGSVFGIEPNGSVVHQAVVCQHGQRPQGNGGYQDSRRGQRFRSQAVAPEGHRPRPPGQPQGPSLARAAAWPLGLTRALMHRSSIGR